MKFSIIYVNYYTIRYILDSIRTLIPYIPKSTEIIVVDNNTISLSEEECIEELNNIWNVKLIKNSNNMGFGTACNIGVSHSTGDVLFFLNPDTLLIEKSLSFTLFENVLNMNKVGIIGLNVSAETRLDFSAGYFPNIFSEVLSVFLVYRVFEAYIVAHRKNRTLNQFLNVDWVMGSALLIKREIFSLVGGFDPKYFLYYEEMDLCYKVKCRGYNNVYLFTQKIHHKGSVTQRDNYLDFTYNYYSGKYRFIKNSFTGNMQNYYKITFHLHNIFLMIFSFILIPANSKKYIGKIRGLVKVTKRIIFSGY